MNIASGSEEPNDKIKNLIRALVTSRKKREKDKVTADLIEEMLEQHRKMMNPNDGLEDKKSLSTRSVAVKNVYKIREEFELRYADDVDSVHAGTCGEWDHVQQFLEKYGTIVEYADVHGVLHSYDGQWPDAPGQGQDYAFKVRNEERDARREGPYSFSVEAESLWTPTDSVSP